MRVFFLITLLAIPVYYGFQIENRSYEYDMARRVTQHSGCENKFLGYQTGKYKMNFKSAHPQNVTGSNNYFIGCQLPTYYGGSAVIFYNRNKITNYVTRKTVLDNSSRRKARRR
jgi:hypothetical protein